VKAAIVTGAGAGIGACIAEHAARDGYRVGVLDVDAAAAARVARRLPGAIALAADIADEAAVQAALDAFGAVPDLLVNNAGIVRFGSLLELPLAQFRAVVEVNLVGCFVVARACARRMLARGGGAIVNITSINGLVPGPGAGAYGATKAAIALLTGQMAIEWGPGGVRVNAVAPGLIDAGMSEPIYADPDTRRARASKVPLGRLGSAEDVAGVVMFLASDAAAYVTGQNIVVDGGVARSIITHLPRPRTLGRAGDPERAG
jgi:NAD(P)-dependent dehydrogenase (short-subunit alcohol dehydrogenase family)